MRKSALLLSCFVSAAGILLAEKTHAPKIDPQRLHDTSNFFRAMSWKDAAQGRRVGMRPPTG